MENLAHKPFDAEVLKVVLAGRGEVPARTSTLSILGAFRLLRENFSHAPSPDMSAASLSMLEQLMVAQAQECIFKGLWLPGSATPDICPDQLQLAQEAAQVRAGTAAQKPKVVATQRAKSRAQGGGHGGGATGTELGWSRVREGWVATDQAPPSGALCHSLKPVAVLVFLRSQD